MKELVLKGLKKLLVFVGIQLVALLVVLLVFAVKYYEPQPVKDDIQIAQEAHCEQVKADYESEEKHEEMKEKIFDYKNYMFGQEGHKDLETLKEEGAIEVYEDVVRTCRLIHLM